MKERFELTLEKEAMESFLSALYVSDNIKEHVHPLILKRAGTEISAMGIVMLVYNSYFTASEEFHITNVEFHSAKGNLEHYIDAIMSDIDMRVEAKLHWQILKFSL